MIGPKLDRRDALKAALTLGLLSSSGRLWAAPKTDARLLVIFLRGAYDAASLLVPVGSDFYYQSRPRLAIARPDPARADSALGLDADWGLHPALRETMLPLFASRELAFVPFAGADDLTRSHFETQDTIEMGQPIGARRNYRSGFMARLAAELNRSRPAAFTAQQPLIFAGADTALTLDVSTVQRPQIDERQAELIAGMYDGTPLAEPLRETFQLRSEVYDQSTTPHGEMADRGAISSRSFELAAGRVGGMMRERFNLGFIDVGGWDTHVNQGAADGYLAKRLEELGRGLAAFKREIGPVWRDSVVLVMSEFGRTFRENGSGGTDHGHGSVYWVLGGSVAGGRVAGPQTAVNGATLFQDRDYPVLTNYRSLIADLIVDMYGLSDASIQTIFSGVARQKLKLI